MSRKALFTVVKIALAVGLLWFVVQKAGFDQVKDRLASIHVGTWLLGLTTIFAGTCISILRWHMLMRSVGLDSRAWPAFQPKRPRRDWPVCGSVTTCRRPEMPSPLLSLGSVSACTALSEIASSRPRPTSCGAMRAE